MFLHCLIYCDKICQTSIKYFKGAGFNGTKTPNA